MRGRMMHDRSGQLAFQAYSADGSKAISSISRHGLNAVLLDAAAKEPGVILHFEERAIGVEADTGELTLDGAAGRHSVVHDVVIGADGAYSALRDTVVRSERADYQPGAPPVGVQGADDRARGVRRLRPRSCRPAHLAARRFDDDRPPEPRPQLHRHAVLAVRRSGGIRRARGSGGDPEPGSTATIPMPRSCSRTSSGSSPATRSARWSRCGCGRGCAGGWPCWVTPPTPSSRSSARA